jgi:hypothetical protein
MLLYFFTLLVNPDANWTTVDYVGNGKSFSHVLDSITACCRGEEVIVLGENEMNVTLFFYLLL